jgi:hypothetical protein
VAALERDNDQVFDVETRRLHHGDLRPMALDGLRFFVNQLPLKAAGLVEYSIMAPMQLGGGRRTADAPFRFHSVVVELLGLIGQRVIFFDESQQTGIGVFCDNVAVSFERHGVHPRSELGKRVAVSRNGSTRRRRRQRIIAALGTLRQFENARVKKCTEPVHSCAPSNQVDVQRLRFSGLLVDASLKAHGLALGDFIALAQRRHMEKHVDAAIVGLYETETFIFAKHLDSASWHVGTVLSFFGTLYGAIVSGSTLLGQPGVTEPIIRPMLDPPVRCVE